MTTQAMQPPTTVKAAALWAWGNAVRSEAALSPLLTAIHVAIQSLAEDDATPLNHRLIYPFSKRIALSGKSTLGSRLPALNYCAQWTGEWHVKNSDLLTWGSFKMWLGRSGEAADMAFLTFQDITKALRCKRIFQAYERYQATGLTTAHCALLAKMGWEMDVERGDWTSLHVQGKRPFGNSDIVFDIYAHAGWEMDWPEDEGPSDDQEERAWDLFDELVFAAKDAAIRAAESLNAPPPVNPENPVNPV